jgi:GDP-L-fucose synthase
MVGSAIFRRLQSEGYVNIITRSHRDLDLADQQTVRAFFRSNRLEYVVLAAAKVGGIHANSRFPADFIYQNLMIQTNVIHEAFLAGVQRLLFLGSSCIYPRHAPQPMREEHLLTGILEPTNEPYAIAKIAGIKLCESYNRQYGTRYRALMPTNLYGPEDNFDLENAHVLPALIRKFHLAKLAATGNHAAIQRDAALFGPVPQAILDDLAGTGGRATSGTPAPAPRVRLWGSGDPRREFLHVDDLADACILVMKLSDDTFRRLSTGRSPESGSVHLPADDQPPASVPHINVGSGMDLIVRELAAIVKTAVGYRGQEIWDPSKPDGAPRKLLDLSRMQKLGWSPRICLEDGIRSTYRWYLERSASGAPAIV